MICNLCWGQGYIYIYVYMSVIWHLPLVRVQKFINIAIFSVIITPNSVQRIYWFFHKVYVIIFSLHFFLFASLEHFTNAKTEAVPNDFSPQVIFCLGECIYLIFIGTWNPSRYFLESEEIWDSFILCDSEESFSG